MTKRITAFQDGRQLASGDVPTVVAAVHALLQHDPDGAVLVFDDADGRRLDIDWRWDADAISASLNREQAPVETRRGPGRPRLGVVAREVTLLPRHWAWLSAQSGGSSVALRKLVEQAMRITPTGADPRQASEAVDRVMLALTGDLPGYEEALRAFYRSDDTGFARHAAAWPDDVRQYVLRLVGEVRRLQAAAP
jgi:hypothetical protein